MKVLIYGLSGAGKTYIAEGLMKIFGDEAEWFNADAIRTKHNDWDFSKKGRERQKQRMMMLSTIAVAKGKMAICDFICPTENARESFNADYEVFVNTINECEYKDTNKLFEQPDYDNYPFEIPHYIVTEHRGDTDVLLIAKAIKNIKST